MPQKKWERPEEYDHVVVVVDDDAGHLELICDSLRMVEGRDRAVTLGRYPRFKVVPCKDGNAALKRVNGQVSALAVDLVLPGRSGIEIIHDLRESKPELAILAYTASAPPSEAVAALAAGADHFHEYKDKDLGSFAHALDLALDRRRLARAIAMHTAEVEEARARLAETFRPALPGLRPPATRESVVPFQEAAHRYLEVAARLFENDPQGLAARLGVSYFALRRLLRRYGVSVPRSRAKHDSD